jgi:hypothetical protein
VYHALTGIRQNIMDNMPSAADQKLKKRLVVSIVIGVVLLGAVFGVAAWLKQRGFIGMSSVAVTDVRRAEILVLATKDTGANVHALTIRVSGEIEGQATLTLILNGEPYKTEQLTGKISFEWGGDWYADTAEIRYEPVNVQSGNVKLQYRFHDSIEW